MKTRLLVCCSLGLAALARPALAQDAAGAEALFQEGRALLRQGKVDQACSKLADSLRLEAATGTLVALALCHEQQKKFASAWAEFSSAAARARRDGRADREKLANERAAALKPRLSTLTIAVSPELAAIEGLVVTRDGSELGESAWNVAVPLDGGEHVVRATAPGRMAWEQRFTVKNEGDVATIDVPTLALEPRVEAAAPEPGAAAVVAQPSEHPAPSETDTAKRPWGTLEWSGVGVASAGAVTLGVGGFFLAKALSENSSAEESCTGNTCVEPGYSDRMSAYEHGNVATVLGIAGGALVATGVTLFVIGRGRGNAEGEPAGTLAVTTKGRGIVLSGTF